jgi:pSer/pThr/pTyr-binding forkhead associated (FHA) protein
MRPQSGSEAKALLEHERAGVPFLVLRDGEGALRVHVLSDQQPALTVGRDPVCDVPLSWDESVSRTHAVLERVGREWMIVDDGISTNGTYVNAVKLTARRRLMDRDTLRVGETTVEFRRPRPQSIGQTRLDRNTAPVVVTPMQRKVLVALCRPLLRDGDGYPPPATNVDIAGELVLSVDAVKTHMRALFERFAVGDLPQNQKRSRVAELAIRSGLVSERDL